jgi:hypothetical protein
MRRRLLISNDLSIIVPTVPPPKKITLLSIKLPIGDVFISLLLSLTLSKANKQLRLENIPNTSMHTMICQVYNLNVHLNVLPRNVDGSVEQDQSAQHPL